MTDEVTDVTQPGSTTASQGPFNPIPITDTVESLLKELLKEVRGLRMDILGNVCDRLTTLRTAIAGLRGYLVVQADDGSVVSAAQLLDEVIDQMDEQTQRVQWICELQAGAIGALGQLKQKEEEFNKDYNGIPDVDAQLRPDLSGVIPKVDERIDYLATPETMPGTEEDGNAATN
jgi:hypothetical protein